MFRSLLRRGRRARVFMVFAMATTLIVAAAGPVSAAGWSAPTKLAAAQATYWANSVATEGDSVVVSWIENWSQLVYRVSTDRGKTFGPRVTVGPSYTPASVTLCGGFVAAVRKVGSSMVLDLRNIDGSISASRVLASGRAISATGNDITCVAGRRLATFWDEWVSGVLRLKVAVVPVVEPLNAYEFDLGVAHLYTVRDITATETHIWMAWSLDDGIIVQRFNVASGPAMKVSKGPRAHIARNTVAPGVAIAAVGKRVYVAYDNQDSDAVIRISNDGGRSFGRAKMLFDSTPAAEASAWNMAARDNVVVASVHVGPWCVGCVGSNRAVYSSNWGRTWTTGPENVGGYMAAIALLGSGPQMRIAQAWDNCTSHETYGDQGFLKIQLGTP